MKQPPAIVFRVLRVAAVVLVLLAITDLFLQRHFRRDLPVRRTNGGSLAALPYLLERLEADDRRAVVFLGSSVLSGVAYTYPHEAAPALVGEFLEKQTGLRDVRCHNLAVPAFTMGDVYCLFSRLRNRRPDLIVLTINPKFFCREVYEAAPIRFPSMWGMARDEDRRRIVAHAGLSFMQKRSAEINDCLRAHWALPRYAPLLGEMLTGHKTPLGEALMKSLAEPLSDRIVNPNRPKAFLREPYRWRKLNEVKVGYLRKAYADLPPRTQNTNFVFLEQLLELAKENNIAVLPYLTPLNRQMNDELNILATDSYERFRDEVRTAVQARGYELLDLTDAVESPWFGDLDHLLYKGHEALAVALADAVAAEARR